jgi:L-threonylcarbamoyladenylate synthase
MSDPRAQLLTPGNLDLAITALCRGGVVAIPTETVYGLAGNARNPEAVSKIFQAKERPSFDPLIVHVQLALNSIERLSAAKIIDRSLISDQTRGVFDALAKAFWPGPLTIIVPKHAEISDLVTSGLNQVGIRMPAHPLAQQILARTGLPLAAPSANRFGRISPTTAQHVMDELGDRIPYVVDGGACDIGIESTVIALDDTKIWLLRPGKISAEELKNAAGIPVERAPTVHEKASPGMLASHYAPRKPLYLIHNLIDLPEQVRANSFDLLVVSGEQTPTLTSLASERLSPVRVMALSERGDPLEAARRLFSTMRTLDDSAGKAIIATAIPKEEGLWLAIMDRLRRASYRDGA